MIGNLNIYFTYDWYPNKMERNTVIEKLHIKNPTFCLLRLLDIVMFMCCLSVNYVCDNWGVDSPDQDFYSWLLEIDSVVENKIENIKMYCFFLPDSNIR